MRISKVAAQPLTHSFAFACHLVACSNRPGSTARLNTNGRFRRQIRNNVLIINYLLREPYLPASYATLDHQARVTFFIRIWMPFSNKCQYPSILTSACIGRLRMRLGLSPPRVSQADKFPILHCTYCFYAPTNEDQSAIVAKQWDSTKQPTQAAFAGLLSPQSKQPSGCFQDPCSLVCL